VAIGGGILLLWETSGVRIVRSGEERDDSSEGFRRRLGWVRALPKNLLKGSRQLLGGGRHGGSLGVRKEVGRVRRQLP